MLRPRIIPCLLMQNGALVKTTLFAQPKYVGDPLNAVRIFNEMEVDELMVIDIDASRKGVVPNEQLISILASECRMPLCYGGGVKTVDQIERLISLGVEKVAISSAAINDPELISRAAERVGRQSIVAVIDIAAANHKSGQEVVIINATRCTGLDPIEFACFMENMGVGEIVINSVNRDGTMNGYDIDFVERIKNAITVPLTVLGAGSLEHIRELIERYPVIGASAGSLFVFKGKYKAVMINYPNREQRNNLLPIT